MFRVTAHSPREPLQIETKGLQKYLKINHSRTSESEKYWCIQVSFAIFREKKSIENLSLFTAILWKFNKITNSFLNSLNKFSELSVNKLEKYVNSLWQSEKINFRQNERCDLKKSSHTSIFHRIRFEIGSWTLFEWKPLRKHWKTVEKNRNYFEKRIFFFKFFEFAHESPLFVVLNQFSSLHPSHFVFSSKLSGKNN